jgi:hypothetical protein
VDASETTKIQRTGGLRRVALIAVMTLVVVLVAVAVYVIAFVILSPVIR